MNASPPTDLPPAATKPGGVSAGWSFVVIVVAIALAFWRLGNADFTWWDDGVTLHQNVRFNPPSLDSLHFYWTHFEAGLYVPVTQTVWLGLAQLAYVGFPDDYKIRLNPTLFHLTSIALHAASSVMVLQLLRRLAGKGWPALAGALLFALHPVQVESVGWISGMKDMLCWCFGLGSVLAYVAHAQQSLTLDKPTRPAWLDYRLSLALVLMIFAALSKPTAMVLPAAMLAIDGFLVRRRWGRAVLELLPLIVLASVTAYIARDAQFVDFLEPTPLWQRPFVAGDAIAFYFRQIIWPAHLTIDYGRIPSRVLASPMAYFWWLVPAIAAIAAGWLVIKRGTAIPIAALALFVIGIAPVSGLATFQMQSFSTVTDHYLYFAMLGPCLLVTWMLSRWSSRGLSIAAMAVLAALGVRTFQQTATWHDSDTLFNHALGVNPKSFLSASNLASFNLSHVPPFTNEAEPYVDRAFAMAPDNFFVLSNYALTKAQLNNRPEAFAAWEACRQLAREHAPHSMMRANFAREIAEQLLIMGEYDRAADWANEAESVGVQDAKLQLALYGVRRAIADHRASTQPTSQPATTPAPAHPPVSAPRPAIGPN